MKDVMKSSSATNRCQGLIRKAVSVAAAAVMACGLVPASAFASAGVNSNGGYYTLPSEMISSFEHTATDAKGNSYTYSYLSSGIERVVGGFSQSMYYIMGINGVNFDRGLRNGSPLEHTSGSGSSRILTADHVTAVDGIMGTEVNSQPDEFLWNSCYRLYQGVAFQSVAGEEDLEVHINASNARTYETVAVTVDGTEYAMPVVIYHEANFISDSDTEWSTSKSIEEWVAIENQREGRHSSNAYDPYVSTWTTNSGGINYGVQLMYALASSVDTVTEASRDANGNATVMSRYVDANGTDDSKYDSATALAQNYEDFAKATQYYMIDKISSGVVKPKVTAVICGYQPAKDGAEAAYACRIYDSSVTGLDNNSANFGGRLANSIMNYSTDINTVLGEGDVAFAAAEGQQNVVRWYYASDIVKAADAVFVTDVPNGNNITSYLAQNQDGNTLSIYSVDNSNYDKSNENVIPLVEAADAADAKAEVYYKYPEHLFGVWYAQGFENCWMAPLAAAYLYPEAFTSVENVMAYAARNFWHINASDVNGVVSATCYDISMPSNTSLGTPDSDYQEVVDNIMAAGNWAYVDNASLRKTIEAKNCGDLVTYDMTALTARASEPESDPTLGFADVDAGDWYVSQGWLAFVVENGLMSGYTGTANFGPYDQVTRAQVATVLYRYANPKSTATEDPSAYADNTTQFSDNDSKQYYTAAINWAFEQGILSGDAGKVRPNDNITRQELAVVISRLAGSATGNSTAAASAAPDWASVADWAQQGVAFCYNSGIMTGSSTTSELFPASDATRAEWAKIVSVTIKNGLA